MTEIKPIGIREININIPQIPAWLADPSSITYSPPVTVNLGVPIVNIPGCVEARETNDLSEIDPRGNMTFCDGNLPYFRPIEFNAEDMQFTGPAQVPKVPSPKKPEPPVTPAIPNPAPPATAKIDCPTAYQQAKEPVGTYIEGFRKKVIEYKLIGKECVQITENVAIPEQIVAGLPSGGQVMTTGGIAVVATASALMAKPLADLLLKVVKPTVKKVMKKIAAIRGKSVPVLSVTERRDLQRERTEAIRALKKVLKPKG